ncbi:unnamed protein product, partial [Nesidiocoris tenuis]
MDDDQVSFGGTTTTYKTFDTFASDWSACSNVSFSRLITKFRPDSAAHKDMLAVLAAVTEVIKENGGSESSTEYFAALLTSLMTAEYDDDHVTAIVNLLAMGIKSVPPAVLRSRFSDACSILLQLLNKYSDSDRCSLVRSILGCLSVLLRAQDSAAWSDSSTLQILRAILAFITFSKPKIRKAAQHSIVSVVKQSEITLAGLAEIASHCTHLVETVSSTGGVTTTLHILTLLKDVIHTFPKKHLKACCEAILKIMTLNNVLINSCSMQALHGLFSSASPDQLPAALGAKLINALYDYQPPPTDSQPIQAWIALMQQAHINLAHGDLRLCVLNLPKLYRTITNFYLIERMDTSACLTLALQSVTMECLSLAAPQSNLFLPYASEIIEIHHSLLSYQYFKSFNQVLHLITALFKTLGENYQNLLLPMVKTLAEFRESSESLFPKEIENAVGAAIRSLGPEVIIKALPLLVNDPTQEFKRSWILPLLKDNVRGSSLKCFIDYFLPLTTVCKNQAEKYNTLNDRPRALSYDLLQSQIWSLLPSFANEPTDITVTFPSMAKALGGVLNTRNDLRLIVLSCIRQLLVHANNASNNNRLQDQSTMARYGKNFLPILFNIYTTKVTRSDEEGVRLASFETIKVYLQVTEPKLCIDFFDRSLEKVKSDDCDKFMKACCLDLLRLLVPYVTNRQQLLDLVIPHLSEPAEQKKYYKLLEVFLSEEALRDCLMPNWERVKNAVLESRNATMPNSKGARLGCIAKILNESEDVSAMVECVLPEAILCLKDINSKTKSIAHKVLATIYEKQPVDEIVTPIFAGLLGSPDLVSCSVLALASLIYHCKDKLSDDTEKQILNNVGLLVLSNSREIASASMAFIKIYITSQPRDKVGMYVPTLMKLFSAMNEDCKKHNRNRTRDIIARLVRWFGGDLVQQCVPPEDEILLLRTKNLAKIHERKRRKRESERASQSTGNTAMTTFSVANHHKTMEEILAEVDNDLDMDNDEEEFVEKGKKKKNKTWITEGGDDIIDFTDSRIAARNITGTKPTDEIVSQAYRKTSKKSTFNTAPDGRLIIADDDSSDDETPALRKKKTVLPGVNIPSQDTDSDDFSDVDDDWMTTAGDSTNGRKRARSISSAGSAAPAAKYQAGGSGIHRPITASNFGGPTRRGKPSKKASNPYVQTGEEYRSKKGRGDVKRKGKPDPFAYLPLRRDALNKRKRMKAMGSLKNVLKAAKRG